MTIAVSTILASVSPARVAIRTLQLRYPRYIHSELMTHRVFSRNASSSRAIPVDRLIADILRDPVPPPTWLSNRQGMQGGATIEGADKEKLDDLWLKARDNAIDVAREMTSRGAHKQHINRVLEPFAHINVLVTSTSWANFYALRDHPDAQPEIRELARQIKDAEDDLRPVLLQPGQWHLPYVTPSDWERVNDGAETWGAEHVKTLIKISVARCARVSYQTHEGKLPQINKDLELYDELVGSTPLHASPAEHQASPDRFVANEKGNMAWERPAWHGNLVGWIQFRKTLRGEYVADEPFSPPEAKVNVDLSSREPENDVPTTQPSP